MNDLYDHVREEMMTNAFDWMGNDLVMLAWTGQPVFDPTMRAVLELSSVSTLVQASEPIVNPTVISGGYAVSSPALFRSVPIGPPITFLTLCFDNPSLEAASLLLFIDTGVNLPYSPNGLDVLIQPDWLTKRGWFRP